MKNLSFILACLSATAVTAVQHSYSSCRSSDASCWPTLEEWEGLNQTVNGNLINVVPPGKHCYGGASYDNGKCKTYRKNYLFDLHRESHVGTMQNINWETCGDEGGCLLQSIFPSLPQTSFLGNKCSQGALPRFALDSSNVDDIAVIVQFAKERKIALNIKNSGHDFLGRSTSPDSLTIWTHNIKYMKYNEKFQPEGALSEDASYPAITMGAGIKWFDAYKFADENNITVVGGAQAGVGCVSGWLQGGGHSPLSSAFGLGVDHVLQFKVVLSTGEFVTANKYQHADLFWALRGGGGGTFGVVVEATMRVHPRVTVQTYYGEIICTAPGSLKKLLVEIAKHSERWGLEGWSGYLYYYGGAIGFTYANPLLSEQEAKDSWKPFTDFLESKPWSYTKKKYLHRPFDSFYKYFMTVMHPNAEIVGFGARISSRLIPREHFSTNVTIDTLVDAIIKGAKHGRPLSYFLPTQILATTAINTRDDNGETSVQPIFRDAVWHVIFTTGWVQGMPEFIKRKNSERVSQAADFLRNITPGGGVYMNEADILEPLWRESFWGLPNYEKLLTIKNKYDPTNVFNCWKCIGWDEAMITSDPKYRCYQY